jgi:hypothetical protein
MVDLNILCKTLPDDAIVELMMAADTITERFAQLTGMSYDAAVITIMQGLMACSNEAKNGEFFDE